MRGDKISRAELERAVRGLVRDTGSDLKKAKGFGMGGVAVLGALAVAGAFLSGRRRGQNGDETYVEVQRIS